MQCYRLMERQHVMVLWVAVRLTVVRTQHTNADVTRVAVITHQLAGVV